jgi:hypothetical protein
MSALSLSWTIAVVCADIVLAIAFVRSAVLLVRERSSEETTLVPSGFGAICCWGIAALLDAWACLLSGAHVPEPWRIVADVGFITLSCAKAFAFGRSGGSQGRGGPLRRFVGRV